ncbi:glutamate 5-kinase [Altererythrobacter sp. MF3-039]|uniref:glutamate 5-kinase n=1 Tax=Altererythrobacter sp. MF3-039 TaxID=3252901 RepID=UPI00390CA07A
MAITALSQLLQARRIVVKVGSSLLIEAGKPRDWWLDSLAQDLAAIRAEGPEVIVVSSGAIALGAARLGMPQGGRSNLADAQAAASVGQVELARLWSQALDEHELIAAQMLVTLGDLEDRRRYLNASATLNRLLAAGVVPVVNENDSVATEEIRFGDNDRLAARVAQAAGADTVLLLSDVDGLYDRDPMQDGAQLIAQVDGITPEVLAMASRGSSSGLGSGGMASKLEAAQIAERAGITLAIINGKHESPIANAVDADVGTVFLPRRSDDARKAWLGGRIAPSGVLTVDAGCARALETGGASLLAAGITAIDGKFDRGDLVEIRAEDGRVIAKGLCEYSAANCHAIKGMREDQQAEVLGHSPRPAVVHRDHLVML